MDQEPLVTEQIEAAARFLGEMGKYVPVRVAFWLKESDEDRWKLYVASDQIRQDNIDVAYGEVLRIAGRMRDPNFDPFQVKIVTPGDPYARSAMDVRDRYPAAIPTRLRRRPLGGVQVEEAYIYPRTAA